MFTGNHDLFVGCAGFSPNANGVQVEGFVSQFTCTCLKLKRQILDLRLINCT